jgi:L-ascorbate metabolism protein UlaG (beta-lactamase superfamily)
VQAPNIVLLTDTHGDHFNGDILNAVAQNATIIAPQAVVDDAKFPAALKAKTKVIANGASVDVMGVKFEAVPMYNTTQDRLQFHNKGRGNGYVVTMGGKRIYIAGDTEDIPEMRNLKNIDMAFIPMNLPYTMDVQHAADAVKAFKPKVVYPYHYGMSDVNAFKTQVGNASDVRLLKWY